MDGSRGQPLRPQCMSPTSSLRGFLQSWFGHVTVLTRRLVEQNFLMTICSAARMTGLSSEDCVFYKHTTIPMQLDTADHIRSITTSYFGCR